MNKLLYVCVIVFALGMMQACEREIDIELPNAEDLLVVEGSIETGEFPKVLITRNRGFFNEFPTDLTTFINEFVVTDAVVTVSDGTNSETLQFTIDPLNYPFVYYTGSNLKGEIGKSYTLTIVSGSKIITSRTQIPSAVPLDSTWFGLNPFNNEEDSLGVSYGQIIDPDTIGNAYRLFAKKNTETAYFPVSGAHFNDDFTNGQKVVFFNGQGKRPFFASDTFVPSDFFYKLGDTILLKFCSIGRKEELFFNTLDAATNSNGNPFSSPVIVKSNIEGGLGIWCGYSPAYDTIIATN
jgi:hypothetical protein